MCYIDSFIRCCVLCKTHIDFHQMTTSSLFQLWFGIRLMSAYASNVHTIPLVSNERVSSFWLLSMLRMLWFFLLLFRFLIITKQRMNGIIVFHRPNEECYYSHYYLTRHIFFSKSHVLFTFSTIFNWILQKKNAEKKKWRLFGADFRPMLFDNLDL